MSETPFIFYQDKKQTVTLPRDWNPVIFANFDDAIEPPDIKKLTRNALKAPVKASCLNKVLSSPSKIAIMVEDVTRPAPKKEILTVLSDELKTVSRKIVSCPFPCLSDVTLTTSFPYKHGAQFIKALAPAALVTKNRGKYYFGGGYRNCSQSACGKFGGVSRGL